MVIAKERRRAERFVRAHVEISIDLDETVAEEDDSLPQLRKLEHGGVREHKDSSEVSAF